MQIRSASAFAYFHSRQVNGQEHKRWQLRKMWNFDKRCHWCKKPTVLIERHERKKGEPKVRHRPDEATIDHLDPRHSNERGKHKGEYRRVLSCLKCNGERDRRALSELPIHTLWEMNGSLYDIAKRSGALNEVDSWLRP